MCSLQATGQDKYDFKSLTEGDQNTEIESLATVWII
jgi:hypothetical protein